MKRGRSAPRARPEGATTTVSGLLGPPPGGHADLEVHVPAALLADLYAPDLVITPRYVGPERRTRTRVDAVAVPRWGAAAPGRGRAGSLRLVEAVLIALVSVGLAVPLTLLASHQASHAVGAAAPPAGAAPGAASAARASAHQAAAAHREAQGAARQLLAVQHRAVRSAQRAARLQAAASRRQVRAADRASRLAAAAQRRAVRAQEQSARAASRSVRTATRRSRRGTPVPIAPTS